MSDLPFVLEILAIETVSSHLTFKVYNLDQTTRTVQGTLNDLEQYINRAQSLRQLGFQRAEFLAKHQQIQACLTTCEQTLQAKQAELPKVESAAQVKIEKFKAEHTIPQYDTRVSETLSTQERRGGLVGGLAALGFGVLVFVTGEGALNKMLGGTFFLGGGLVAYGAYVTQTDDSSYAQRQRQLKREAEKTKELITATEQQTQQAVLSAKHELQQYVTQRAQLQAELESAEGMVELSEMLHQVNQRLGDGILYGEETLLRSLEFLLLKRQAEGEAFAKNLAGAAVLGLMVIGAFAGFSP